MSERVQFVDGKFGTQSIGTRRSCEFDTGIREAAEKVCSLQDDTKVIQKPNPEVMRRYGEQNDVVGRSVGKLVKSISTRFAGIETCISRDITNRRLQNIPELGYFSAQLRRKWTGGSKQKF